MKKSFVLLAAISGMAITPAFADDNAVRMDVHAIQRDIDAITKDDAALQKDRAALSKYREAKAQDIQNGDSGKQAVDSTKIGGVLTEIAEKKAERKIDRDKLDHDEAAMHEDKNDAEYSNN